MINARRIVKARQARGEGADGEIAGRKKRQATVGIVVNVLLLAILLLASVLRTGSRGGPPFPGHRAVRSATIVRSGSPLGVAARRGAPRLAHP